MIKFNSKIYRIGINPFHAKINPFRTETNSFCTEINPSQIKWNRWIHKFEILVTLINNG